MDRLAHQRERAGDHRLAGDDGGNRCQQHDRQQAPFREHQEERVGHVFRLVQHHGTLPEIVQCQRRKNEDEPGDLDRLASEMAKVRIKRLRPGHGQEHRA